MNAHPINPCMDNYSLKENQHKIAEAIFNDYSVLKFGEYGEKYLYAVCDYDVRKYHSLRSRPDFRQFIADKDTHYRRQMSILMARVGNLDDSFVDRKTNAPDLWDFVIDRTRRNCAPKIDAQILFDVKKGR